MEKLMNSVISGGGNPLSLIIQAFAGGKNKPALLRTKSEKSHKKAAFTLAEVLITLGIIGVVAAMTIPTLITNHQKKATVTKLQRALSVLNQAYRLSYNDNGDLSAQGAYDAGAQAFFEQYWAPYIKVSRYCEDYAACGYSQEQPWQFLSGDPMAVSVDSNRANFYTMDGIFFMILVNSGVGNGVINTNIYVDLNGSQGPNVAGKDVFIFDREIDDVKGGAIRMKCWDKSNAEVNNNCTARWGYCCAEKIRRDGWQMTSTYPWK